MKQRRLRGDLKPANELIEFVKERCPGFEYYGGYTGCDGRADIRCLKCGTVFNRSMISIRKNQFCCPECKKKEQLEFEKIKEQREKEKKEKQKIRKSRAYKNRMKRSRQIEIGICKICGSLFYKKTSRQEYCSDPCRSKAIQQNSKYNQGSDDRLNRENIVDRDISLEKLYERDKGICQICGGKCDFNDYVIKDNGVFIAGNLYPSKDHIIPLSMGGKHSWDNVRLAHRGCNTKIFFKFQRLMPSLPANVTQKQ
jgi:5-methylcytosine-specific restriction endonuclease McrA